MIQQPEQQQQDLNKEVIFKYHDDKFWLGNNVVDILVELIHEVIGL